MKLVGASRAKYIFTFVFLLPAEYALFPSLFNMHIPYNMQRHVGFHESANDLY